MTRFHRIYQLHRILTSHRYPVSHQILEQQLECSRATVTRAINVLRDYFNAPVAYNRERNGYHYVLEQGGTFELPGVWFDADELYALLTVQHLLEHIQPGLLGGQLKPIKSRLEKILAAQNLTVSEMAGRIRIQSMMGRRATVRHFRQVASTLLQRKQLNIVYHSRGNDHLTQRTISPQRLTHYRDNWYLDAWYHKRNALRSFALERIKQPRQLDRDAREVTELALDQHFAASYGIFSGKARYTAVLRFSAERARWVADEQWHPRQQGKFLADGCYELRIPYASETELIMDILKHGAAVEVVAPPSLRRTIVKKIYEMQENYANGKSRKK